MTWGLLSRYRAPVYGLAMLWIMFFHGLRPFMSTALDKRAAFLTGVVERGSCGVDMFLFLSGICLYFSMQRQPDVKAFYQRRLVRIVVPLLLIDGAYWGYTCLYAKGDVLAFVKNLSQLSFWCDGYALTWFIALLLPLYAIYPWIYRHVLLKNNKRGSKILLGICLFIYAGCWMMDHGTPAMHVWFSHTEIAWTRIPVFLLGCVCDRAVYEDRAMDRKILFVTFLCLLYGLFFMNNKFSLTRYYRIPFLLIGPSVVVWSSILFSILRNRVLDRLFAFVGDRSLELYLAHVPLQKLTIGMAMYAGADKVANYHRYILYCIGGAFLLSCIVTPLSNKMNAYVRKKQRASIP